MIAVSAYTAETAINTEQAADVSLLASMSNVAQLDRRRESNEMELNGKEEPDYVYDLGALASLSLDFEKMQPQHAAFVLAYALGAIANSAAGAGYLHAITPISGDVDADRSLETFTAVQRFGQTILKRRFASFAVDSFTLTAERDAWVKLSAQCKGTGKFTDSVVEESITAKDDATSLTLAANAVQGSTAAARLDNIHRIRCELATGVWTEVAFSAVSAATPAVITITAPGSATADKTYKVLYTPAEAAWGTFPARVSETPLRVSQCTLKLGGTWSGSAFAGGRELDAEVNSVEWSFQNNLDVQFNFGAGGTYASRIFRNGRMQTLKLNREMRNCILQQHIADNDTFGVYLLCSGGAIDGSHNYQLEVIWPKCAVMQSPLSVDGKKMAEAGDLLVLEDDTYGSVIVGVKNLQAAYMA